MEANQLPVSLHGVFWTTSEQQQPLEDAAADWYSAMARNAGFRGGTVQRPKLRIEGGPAVQTDAPWGGGTHAIETTSFWHSEKDRAAWVLTPPHDPVFACVTGEATERISNRLEIEYLLGAPAGSTAMEHSTYSVETEREWLQLRRDLLEVAAAAARAAGFCCFALLRKLPKEQRTTFVSNDRLLSVVGAGTDEDALEMETMSYWRTKDDLLSWMAVASPPNLQPTTHGFSEVLHSWGAHLSDQPRL